MLATISRAFFASSSWLAAEVVSLGGFWVKLAQTASVISALPDASLGKKTLFSAGNESHHFIILIYKTCPGGVERL